MNFTQILKLVETAHALQQLTSVSHQDNIEGLNRLSALYKVDVTTPTIELFGAATQLVYAFQEIADHMLDAASRSVPLETSQHQMVGMLLKELIENEK